MIEAGVAAPGGAPDHPSSGGAGALLRAARQTQGLHIGALAAAMKVPQAKLEALEAERYGELLDATFTRALAHSVCRALKIDPAPVLARLPQGAPAPLDRVEGGLNTPFRDRPGRIDPVDWGIWRQPAFWIVALVVLATVGVATMPVGWFQGVARSAGLVRERTAAPEATSATAIPALLPASALAGGIVEREGAAVSSTVVESSAAAASSASAPEAQASEETAQAAAVAHAATRIRALESTWVQVTDNRGQILLSRLLPAGEEVGLDVEPPLKIRVGNARGTEVLRHGHVVDLSASTRDNIANLELQ